jgi:hypothetical protein
MSLSHVAAFGCADRRQAFVSLLRRKPLARDGTVAHGYRERVTLTVPGLDSGRYTVTTYDTEAGAAGVVFGRRVETGALRVEIDIGRDLARSGPPRRDRGRPPR